MKTFRILHVTDKSFNERYYVVEEKKVFLGLFSFWKVCKYFSGDPRSDDSCYRNYTFKSVEKAKDFLKEKYVDFSLSETVLESTYPDAFEI
ncbi:hypothetical protein [Serratia sp. Se-RSBMAAmG]|uniref:hypothetical protein n=1 Tax=Serratia sp. Se-RSBMAAmG TaxID=3043305 RepID=UPI0024AFC727|nr:hypothetical protein [Serratia sp. Se-RSBMAAmG]MDI6976509.1 hypothetical protein [Serratia sp. Se-RSBMAAmG]